MRVCRPLKLLNMLLLKLLKQQTYVVISKNIFNTKNQHHKTLISHLISQSGVPSTYESTPSPIGALSTALSSGKGQPYQANWQPPLPLLSQGCSSFLPPIANHPGSQLPSTGRVPLLTSAHPNRSSLALRAPTNRRAPLTVTGRGGELAN